MANLGDKVTAVAYKLGNRTDLTTPIGSPITGVITGWLLNGAGQNYLEGDILSVEQGSNFTAEFEVVQVNDLTGAIETIVLSTGGNGYTIAGLVSLTGGSGSGAGLTITEVSSIEGDCRIDYWLRDAYINLMMENKFPATEVTYTFYTAQGQDVYPYPDSIRAIEALTLYRPDGTIITVEDKDIKYIRRMNPVNQAAPSMWCEYNNQIIFRPTPDSNGPYTCTLDGWQNPIIGTPIQETQNLLPLDWHEALVFAATLRGHVDLQEEDKAMKIQSFLNGFTDPTGKYTPGLLGNLQSRLQISARFKDWGLQPAGTTQTYTRRR